MFSGSFLGRCGKDAEILTGASGEQYVALNVAESYYSKGETLTRWYKVYASFPRALKLAQYWKKGRLLEVVGELVKHNIYEDKDGKPQLQLVVNAFRVEFPPVGKKRDEQTGEQKSSTPPPVSEEDVNNTPQMPFEAPAGGEGTDDLPF
jgi:single-strand DNA-binding protein